MSEPLPDLPDLRDLPTAWTVCPLCGVVVPAPDIHREWHQALVDRVRRAEDLLATARNVITDLNRRVQTLESKG